MPFGMLLPLHALQHRLHLRFKIKQELSTAQLGQFNTVQQHWQMHAADTQRAGACIATRLLFMWVASMCVMSVLKADQFVN